MLVERFRILVPHLTPRTILLHVGAGDARLAIHAASYVERVYAVGLTRRIPRAERLPLNFRLGWPPQGGVDIAFSDQLEDANLAAIRASLAPGGKYLVLAENAFLGRFFPRYRLVPAFP